MNTVQEAAVKIVIYREGPLYLYGRWHGDERVAQAVIDGHRAQSIISHHPTGSTPTGNEPDFGPVPCNWQWSVELERR